MLICLSILFQPVSLLASEIDAEHKCSLTVTYSKGDVTFEGLEIYIYRVSDVTEDGELEKVDPFDKYPVNVQGVTSQTEWNDIALTIRGYVSANALEPYRSGVTDPQGRVSFADIETGLYYVMRVTTEKDGTTYTFFDTMVCIPMPDGDGYEYDLSIKPKSKQTDDAERTYTVTKLWCDENGNERPDAVTVDILTGGEVLETVTLNAGNNWTYSFAVKNGDADLSVVEKNVPEGYTVKMTEREASFIITNTKEEGGQDAPPPSDAPQTGEDFPINTVAVLLAISGIILVIFGSGQRRKDNVSQK